SVADVVVLAKNMMSDDLDMKGAIQKVLEKYPHFKASAKEEQKPTFTTGEHKKPAGVDPFIAGLGLNKQGGDSTMANAINYAEQYRSELDQVLKQNMLTNELETSNVVWLGAKTCHVPTLSVTGYQDHSRNGGWNRGDVTVEDEPYTLQFDRDVEFFVDQMDIDESNQAASAANITRVLLQEHAGPEVDAYRFGKMAQHAISQELVTEEDVDSTSVYQRLKSDILKVRKYGPSNLIAYISSEAMDALERSNEFQRVINVQNQGTAIETRVTSLDGVRLVEVWDMARFNTAHDFTQGFVPEGQDINWV